MAASLFEVSDEQLDYGYGGCLRAHIISRFQLESFGVIAKVDSHFPAGEELAEDSCGVGVRETEAQGVFLNLVCECELGLLARVNGSGFGSGLFE